ncbi:MAG: aminopeptidase [Flavobacteriales bacterium]|nr:aminopeptidase [Flavobacteriales bacterium]
MRNKVILILLLISLGSGVFYGEMISYGIQQGVGQFHILYDAVPITDLLNDPNYPEDNKEKLRLIQEIREFAIDSLGLNDSESYKKLFDQEGQPVLWVITAAMPFEMEPYEWYFPFLGRLGYKGFFNKEKALLEEQALIAMDYDTDLGAVNAWSTLGYFNDPVLSNMLHKSPGGLARLIIHELTHGTLYTKGDDGFNENLATFVGDNGAIVFMKHKYGENSIELKRYVGAIEDILSYSKHMTRGTSRLDSLYGSMKQSAFTFEEKVSLKEGLIRDILSSSDTIDFNNAESYQYVLQNDFMPNNTYFMTFKRYREKQNEFQAEFDSKFNGNFSKYLSHLKEQYAN